MARIIVRGNGHQKIFEFTDDEGPELNAQWTWDYFRALKRQEWFEFVEHDDEVFETPRTRIVVVHKSNVEILVDLTAEESKTSFGQNMINQ